MAEEETGGESLPGGDVAAHPSAPAKLGLDSVAAAAALDAAKTDPALSSEAAAYFRKQTQLVDLQIVHFDEDNRIATRAAGQRALMERLKYVIQFLLTLTVCSAAVIAVLLTVEAMNARAVLMEPFETPPALAAKGLSGKIAATAVMDRLTHLQNQTFTVTPGRQTTGSWQEEIKIQVPQTGISLGELGSFLRARLGHDIHLAGDVVQPRDGQVALTVRGDKIEARTFTGPEDDFDALAEQAAEYLFGAAEPIRFAAYLIGHRTPQELLAFTTESLPTRNDPGERLSLVEFQARALYRLDRSDEAVRKARVVVDQQPFDPTAWEVLMSATLFSKGSQAQYDIGQEATARWKGAPRGTKPLRNVRSDLDYLTQDWNDIPPLLRSQHRATGAEGTSSTIWAEFAAATHDWDLAELQATNFDVNRPVMRAASLKLIMQKAIETGDTAKGVATGAELAELERADPRFHNLIADADCQYALLLSRSGQTEKAEAIFQAHSLLEACAVFRADAFEGRGLHLKADTAYAQAASSMPSLALSFQHWGLARLARGDLNGAELEFEQARRRAPRWAEPLKGQGDVMARQRRWKEALAKYAAASAFAPAWPQLREARVEALHGMSKPA